MDASLLHAFSKKRILVVGDFILDRYLGGDTERISPEAPVPIMKVEWASEQLGGAGNVVNNIQSMTGNTRVLTYIGCDPVGDRLMGLLTESGADVAHVLRFPEFETIRKVRVVARKQQLVRMDFERVVNAPEKFVDYIHENSAKIFDSIDVVIISDYGKGVVTLDVSQSVINEAKVRNIPVLVDPKGGDWEKYSGATLATPNLSEFSAICGSKIKQSMEDEIRDHSKEICRKYSFSKLLVTRSERGMSLVLSDGSKKDYPVVAKEVIDVSGAGDTVISTMALCIASGFSDDDCCTISNKAASVAVSKFGTSPVTLAELTGVCAFSNGKVVDIHDIPSLSEYLHGLKKKIVFTNGCFDMLHPGHIHSLEVSKSFGDVLVVGLNSDRSVRALKGPERPIIPEGERAYVLKSLSVVDFVVIFDDDTPKTLIEMLSPDVLVKGAEYVDKEVVGREHVELYGGVVQFVNLKEGFSTTNLISKIRNGGR